MVYINEKVNWGFGEAKLNLFNASYICLKYFSSEISKLNKHKLKILDVGCSTGALTNGLKTLLPDNYYYGSDISKSSINIAKIRYPEILFRVSDAQKLSYKSNSFDVVIIHSVLDHLPKPENALKEVRRILKKDGLFLSMTPIEAEPTTIHGILNKYRYFRNHRINYCGHLQAFTEKELIKLIKSRGFKMKRKYYSAYYFFQIIDVLYYPFLALIHKGPESGFSNYVYDNKNLLGGIIKVATKLVKFIENVEALLFSRMIKPGFFCYYTFIKT
jgi:ubiquinone/menaquinone biosynthesis C-methylase UbiE